ncbi:hypothetical protein [Streptomyces sp. NBC_00096]|uniref:hypothetical protein n=1 Tax=Streptomyces sp. NBC_00096 TaxID=2975650 RepID=UPI003253A1FE
MPKHVPFIPVVVAPAFALALGACSGGGAPKVSGSLPHTEEEIAHYDGFGDNGVAIAHTDCGVPRVEKDDEAAKRSRPERGSNGDTALGG